MGGNAYLELLDAHLSRLLGTVRPDFAFYLSGVDVLGTDRYGHLDLSLEAHCNTFRVAKDVYGHE